MLKTRILHIFAITIEKMTLITGFLLIIVGGILLFGLTTKIIIINPSIYKPINYKTSKNVKNSIIILEKHLKQVNRH